MGFNRTLTESITTPTEVYSPTAATGTVIGMSITSRTTAATVDILVGTTYLVKGLVVAAGTAAMPVGGMQKLVLVTSDSLKVVSDTAVDVIVSFLEG